MPRALSPPPASPAPRPHASRVPRPPAARSKSGHGAELGPRGRRWAERLPWFCSLIREGKRKDGWNRAGGARAQSEDRRALSGRWRGRGAGDERARRVRGRRGRAERCVLVGQFRAPRYVAARQPRRDGRPPPQSPRPRPPPARRHWPRRQGRAPRRPAPPRPVLSAAAPPPVRVLLWPRPQLLSAVRGDPRRALCCATGRTAEQPGRDWEKPGTPLPIPGRALWVAALTRWCGTFFCLFVCLFPGEPQRAGLPVASRTPGEGYGDLGVTGTLALCPWSSLRPGKGRGSLAAPTEMSRSSPSSAATATQTALPKQLGRK